MQGDDGSASKKDLRKSPEITQKKKSTLQLTVDDFTLKYRLGKGAYGDVFFAVKNSDQQGYAMKQIQKKKLEKEGKEYQALVEKQLLTCFKHPGIIKLRYAFQDKKILYFILQYCEGGQFIEFIRLNIGKLTQEIKVFYIAEIVNLLEYLHSHGVIHRDLKPQNLMLDGCGHLKLIDFGTAEITNATILSQDFRTKISAMKQKDEETQLTTADQNEDEQFSPKKKERRSTFVGTCYYISPELLEYNHCPPSADLWALGCIIYQLYYLETPFKDNYEFAVFEKIKKAEVNFPKSAEIPQEAVDLIKQLLLKNPDERLGSCSSEELSFKALKQHRFFKGFDVDNIFKRPPPQIREMTEPKLAPEQQQINQQKINRSRTDLIAMMKNEVQQDQRLLIHGVVQKKAFISYTCYYLIVYRGLTITRIKAQDLAKKKELQIDLTASGMPAKLVSQCKFQLTTKQKTYTFKTEIAEKWVALINAQFLRLKSP